MTDPFQLQDPARSAPTDEARASLLARATTYREQGRVDDALDIYWRLSEWATMARYLVELERPVDAGNAWLRRLPFLPVRGDALGPAEASAAREAARCFLDGGLVDSAVGMLLNLGEREAAVAILRDHDAIEADAVDAGQPFARNPWPDGTVSSRPPPGSWEAAASRERPLTNPLATLPKPPATPVPEPSANALDAMLQVPIGDPHYIDVAELVARLALKQGRMSLPVARFLEPLMTGEGLGGRTASAEVLYTLGRLHEGIGLNEKARIAYGMALARDPQHRKASIRAERLDSDSGVVPLDLSEGDDPFSRSLEVEASLDDQEALRQRVRSTTTEFNLGPLGPGSVIADRYELTDPIGEGGCGVVFAAQDREGGGEVAIKILREGAGELRAVARFEREIAICRDLDHPNVVALRDSGVWRKLHWIAMERLDGIDLGVLLRRVGRPLPVVPALRVLRESLLGMRHAHEHGVVHRDIKPSNIFVVRRTHDIKLLDFGLAFITNDTRFTRAGTTVGSPRYMAPERLRGDQAFGPWTDLYALGVVTYRMLTAVMPFKEKDLVALLDEIATTEPVPVRTLNANTPEALEAIVLKLMARDPEQRYRSVDAVLADLDSLEHRLAAERGAEEPAEA